MRVLLVGAVASAILSAGCKSSGDAPIAKDRVEQPSSVSGWTEIKTSGFALSFPSGWSVVDITTKEIGADAEKRLAGKPGFESKRVAMQHATQTHAIKLMVRTDALTPEGIHSVADVVEEPSGGRSLDEEVRGTVASLGKSVLPGTTIPTSDVQTPGGRFVKLTHQYFNSNSLPRCTFLYITTKNDKIYVVGFTTSPGSMAEVEKVADQSMKTFRFE